jgi:hypothetical protein
VGEHAGAGKQDDGEDYLGDDKGFLRERGAIAGAAVGSAQGFDGVGVGGEPGGGDAEEDAGDHGEREGEGEDGKRWGSADGQEVCGAEGHPEDQAGPGVGDGDADQTSGYGEHDAFGEGLPDKAAA